MAHESLVKIDRDLPFDLAAVFGCAVMTGVGAVVNTAALPPNSSVAVIGLGGVGLAALLGARARDARLIAAIDLAPSKLALASELGATYTFEAAAADCADAIREATGGGVEFAFEMAGSAKAMELAYRITRRGGTTVTAGLSHPSATFAVPHLGIVAEERTIKGSYLGSCDPQRDIPRYIEWYRQGRLPVERLLSERVALEELNVAFDRLRAATTVRQVLVLTA
jgi:alcohol dehydrogenase